MPNDPRIKFKKKVYDPSRNLMYEARTGGGGGSFPSGGGDGPKPKPRPAPTPTIYVPPVHPPHVDPFVPFGPFKPAILPFDPYQRRLKARAEATEAKIKLEENARVRARTVTIKSLDMQDVRGREPSVLDNTDYLVDAPPSRVPRVDIKPVDFLNPNRPPRIPRILNPNDIVPNALGTPQEQMAAYAEGQAIRNELLGPASTVDEVEALGKTTLAQRNAKMRAEGRSQEYIDNVNKIINENITAKKLRLETQTLPLEHQLEYALKDITDPRTPLDEIPAHKANIDELRYELQKQLEIKNIQAMDAKAANPTPANKAKVTKLKKELNRMIEANIDYERPEELAMREYQKSLPSQRTNVDPLDAEDAEMRSLQERLNELRDTPTRPREGSLTTQTLEDSLAVDKSFEEYQAKQAARLEEMQANERRGGPRPAGEATEAEAAGIGGGPPRARPVEPAPEPAPAAPARQVEPEEQEMGGLAARNHVAEFNELYDTLVDAAKENGFKPPEAPETIKTQGELAVKKFQYEQAMEFAEANDMFISETAIVKGERKPTGRALSKRGQQRNLEKYYEKAVAQQNAQPSRPSQASSSSSNQPIRTPAGDPTASIPPSPPERSVEMQSSSQRQGVMDTLFDRISGNRDYQPMDSDILDTIDEMQGGIERGGRVPTSDIELQDLGGNVERGGRVSTDAPATPTNPMNEKIAKLREKIDTATADLTKPNTPSQERYLKAQKTKAENELKSLMNDLAGSSTDTPPTRPVTDRVTRSQTRSGLEPMELETVDIAPSARPSARGRGRAKIEPIRPVGPKPIRNLGRGTDVNIQGGQNPHVSSQFINKQAQQLSTSLRGLSSRVPTLRAPSAATLKTIGREGGKTVAGLVIGIGVSYLMAKYFKEHPATEKYSQIGQEFAVSFSGAAAGNIVIRAIGIAGRLGMKTLTRAGAQMAAKEALYATGEAAAFVAVQMAVEMSIEAIMDNYKFSHAASKTTAAFTGGVLGAGIGFKQGGYAGLALMTAFGAYSTTSAYFEGKEMDEEEASGRKTSAEVTVTVNNARRQLVKNMAQTNNNYDAAYALLRPSQRRDLGLVGDDAQELFKKSLLREFDPLSKDRYGNPFLPPEVEPERDNFKENVMLSMDANLASMFLNYLTSIDPAGGGAISGYQAYQQEVIEKESLEKDKYYQEYIEWYMHKMSTPFYNVPQPSGPGLALLERDTAGSWRSSAEFSAELVYQQNLHYTATVNKAREQVLEEWHSNMVTMGEMTNRDIVDMANLGGNFADQYDKYIVTNAAAQLTAQFNENGVNYRDADQRLVAVANRDPTILPALDHYYEVMIQLSKDTELPIAELARLNALPEVEQGRELGKINLLRERVVREGLISDKAAVDEFNAGLIRDMQSYGENFEAIMTNINTQQMLMGYSYLYGTNRIDFYRQLHLEAPVIVIPPNPYAASTEFDYDKNRTPGDTAVYGYRYNLTDEQNQELEDYLYYKNRELYQKGDTKGRLTTADAMAKAAEIYDRDISIYRKSDDEVAKENNMTLEEYYGAYGYDMGKAPPPEPIEWKDITERDPPPGPNTSNPEDNIGAGERAANAAMQAARIAGGGTADEFDRMAAGAYQNSLRAGEGGDIPQPGINENGETIRQENDPDGP